MFQDARKSQSFMRLGLTGPSGSGKTMSALLVAFGLAGDWSKVGMVCTEGGSGALYAGYDRNGIQIGIYKFLKLEPPYEPQKYIAAINDAVKAGLKVVILDTISHAWAGTGGLLDKHGKLADTGKFNSFTAWRMVTPEHNALVDAMLQSPIHVIATLRVKTEWVVEENEKGKAIPRKIGLAPVQREGMEYEFTVVFDLSHDHSITVSKDRTGIFDGKIFVPTAETGREMLSWLNEAEPESASTKEKTKPVSDAGKAKQQDNAKTGSDEKTKQEKKQEPAETKTEPEQRKTAESENTKQEEKKETSPESPKEEKSKNTPAQESQESASDSYPTTEIILGRLENLVEIGDQVFRTAKFSDKTIGAIFALQNQGKVYEDLKTLRGGSSYTVTIWEEIPEGERPGLPDTLQKGHLIMVGEITPVKAAA